MKYLIKPVLVLSAIGLLLSLVAHITALLGIDLGLGESIFALHIGIFVVWLPTVMLTMKMGRGSRRSTWGFGGGMSWKHVLSGCPAWMRYVMYAVFAYVLLNFFLSTQGAGRGAGMERSEPEMIRGFSGHWLVFYYAAFAVSYSALMKPELLGEAACKLGHKNSPGDKFCSECGNPVMVRKESLP